MSVLKQLLCCLNLFTGATISVFDVGCFRGFSVGFSFSFAAISFISIALAFSGSSMVVFWPMFIFSDVNSCCAVQLFDVLHFRIGSHLDFIISEHWLEKDCLESPTHPTAFWW
jgi:hypothetical protein